MQENGNSSEMQIGQFDSSLSGCINKMRPILSGFLQLGVPALNRCTEASTPWVTIDEIGYLENNCPEYLEALLRLFEKKQVIAAIRKQDLPHLTSILTREDVFILDVDDPFRNTGCVIMASGLGKRFGSNKLMADFHGHPMIESVLTATRAIPHRVVVTRHTEVADYCGEHDIPCVLHDLPYRSDTVRLGLEALPNLDRCIFCPADQPLLQEQTLWTMAMAGVNSPDRILRLASDGTPGAPILFPLCCFDELKHLPQGMGGSSVVKKHPEQVHFILSKDKRELMDVDTPEDLAYLLAQ